MTKKVLEKSEMSSVEFCQRALREHVAPPSVGSMKARLRLAARRLGWTTNRVKDAWYADPRIRISADELRAIEDLTGLSYGRRELRTNEELIAKATALLDGTDPDFHSAFVAGLVAFARAFHRS